MRSCILSSIKNSLHQNTSLFIISTIEASIAFHHISDIQSDFVNHVKSGPDEESCETADH